MAQSHNMGKNVLPVRAAAPHGLSSYDSTPCGSEVQQQFPLHLIWCSSSQKKDSVPQQQNSSVRDQSLC